MDHSRYPAKSGTNTAEKGYVVAITALLMLPLLAFTGLAIDIGGWYAEGQRIQRAADAASTAGVAHLPNISAATAEAVLAAGRNGLDVNSDEVDILVEQEGELELRVTIVRRNVDQFFTRMIRDDVTIARSAVSKYVPTIPFGSNSNSFGENLPNGCDSIDDPCAGPGPFVGFWGSINGPKTGHSSGDPFATLCLGTGNPCSDSSNPQYRSTGYDYAIDVPESLVGSTVTLELFDAAFIRRADNHDGTGDGPPNVEASRQIHTQFSVFDADGLAVGYSTDTPLPGCTRVYQDSGGSGGATIEATHRARWAIHCTFVPTEADLYPVRVQSSGFSGADTDAYGWNQFSMRATSSDLSGINPRIYALGDMSIHSNREAATVFKLAEILPDYRGKAVTLSLFDAGDGQGTSFTLVPIGPDGELPTCEYRSWVVGGAFSDWTDSDDSSRCAVNTRVSGTSLYNDKWLQIRIRIPNDYNCSDCWWEIRYETSNDALFFERTVWSTTIDGDPLRLIE
jgi:hypothetical protein